MIHHHTYQLNNEDPGHYGANKEAVIELEPAVKGFVAL
jgi:hypothetical protein